MMTTIARARLGEKRCEPDEELKRGAQSTNLVADGGFERGLQQTKKMITAWNEKT